MPGARPLNDLDRGIVCGLLLSQGSFGGDGRQPQVSLRMHVRHETLMRWLADRLPGSRLYGPYHHGGRDYFQWLCRGRALVDELLPVLDGVLDPALDEPAAQRLAAMTHDYAAFIDRVRSR